MAFGGRFAIVVALVCADFGSAGDHELADGKSLHDDESVLFQTVAHKQVIEDVGPYHSGGYAGSMESGSDVQQESEVSSRSTQLQKVNSQMKQALQDIYDILDDFESVMQEDVLVCTEEHCNRNAELTKAGKRDVAEGLYVVRTSTMRLCAWENIDNVFVCDPRGRDIYEWKTGITKLPDDVDKQVAKPPSAPMYLEFFKGVIAGMRGGWSALVSFARRNFRSTLKIDGRVKALIGLNIAVLSLVAPPIGGFLAVAGLTFAAINLAIAAYNAISAADKGAQLNKCEAGWLLLKTIIFEGVTIFTGLPLEAAGDAWEWAGSSSEFVTMSAWAKNPIGESKTVTGASLAGAFSGAAAACDDFLEEEFNILYPNFKEKFKGGVEKVVRKVTIFDCSARKIVEAPGQDHTDPELAQRPAGVASVTDLKKN